MNGDPRRRPGNLSHLQRLANSAAAAADVPVGRYQRWINTQILSAILDRVRDEDGDPLFTLKGGAAMELRLGLTARATKDYDAVFRARAEDILDALDRALTDDWQGFQIRRSEPEQIRDTNALRMQIRLSYKGRSWGTVQLEVAPSEGASGQEIDRVSSRTLEPVQLESPDRIACVSVRYQIAQKLHACTQIYADGRENDRFRDLIDLPLLRELLDDNAIASVRAACIEICEIRGTHAWPPAVTVWPSWPDGFAAMAREIAFHTEDVNTAADDVRALITEIDRA